MGELHYENGNIHSPVIVLGDDPSTEGNSLVVRLGTAVSVPTWTVTQEEGTPEAPESTTPNADAKDAEIADLKKQLAAKNQQPPE